MGKYRSIMESSRDESESSLIEKAREALALAGLPEDTQFKIGEFYTPKSGKSYHQVRYITNKSKITIPKGNMDDMDERSFITTAFRELFEETGVRIPLTVKPTVIPFNLNRRSIPHICKVIVCGVKSKYARTYVD